jgi:hypothetical protein
MRGCRGFDRRQIEVGVWRSIGIEQHRCTFDVRRNLFQQFHPFAANRRLDVDEACDIAAGSSQAVDKAVSDGVGHQHKYDRRSLVLRAQCRNDRRRAAENNIRFGASDVARG